MLALSGLTNTFLYMTGTQSIVEKQVLIALGSQQYKIASFFLAVKLYFLLHFLMHFFFIIKITKIFKALEHCTLQIVQNCNYSKAFYILSSIKNVSTFSLSESMSIDFFKRLMVYRFDREFTKSLIIRDIHDVLKNPFRYVHLFLLHILLSKKISENCHARPVTEGPKLRCNTPH